MDGGLGAIQHLRLHALGRGAGYRSLTRPEGSIIPEGSRALCRGRSGVLEQGYAELLRTPLSRSSRRRESVHSRTPIGPRLPARGRPYRRVLCFLCTHERTLLVLT